MSEPSRFQLIEHAKLCIDLMRYEDVIDCIEKVIQMGQPLSYVERKMLFSTKAKIRQSLLETESFLKVYLERSGEVNTLFKNLKSKVENEIAEHCDNYLKLLDNDHIKNDENADAIVDYKCRRAQQHYIKLIYVPGNDKDNDMRKTREMYEDAMKVARESLVASHPVRLWTALQVARFHKNIRNSVEDALAVAKQAHDECVSNLFDLSVLGDSDLSTDSMIFLANLGSYIEKLT